jgi:hypothetical protein
MELWVREIGSICETEWEDVVATAAPWLRLWDGFGLPCRINRLTWNCGASSIFIPLGANTRIKKYVAVDGVVVLLLVQLLPFG